MRSFARILCLLAGISFFALALHPSPARGAADALSLVRADDSGIEAAVSLSGVQPQTISTVGGTFSTIEIPFYGFSQTVGEPRLPVLRRLVELPFGANARVTATDLVFREIPVSSPLIPVQPPQPKTGPAPAFAYDAAAYLRAGFSGSDLVSFEEAGILRGHRLGQLTIRAVDYDPAGGRLRILESARIRVEWTGADQATTRRELDRYASGTFTDIVRRATLGGGRYDPAGEIGYLVIASPAFAANADLLRLLDWKTQRGFHVTLVSTDQTGPTKEQIKAYIQNAYNTWTIPPTFVLLVGDVNGIPAWVGIGADSPTTDLNYAMLEGNDYLPDVAIGRLGLADATDMANIVNKTLQYEQVGWTGNNDWEKHATFMASSDNYTVSEGTHNYVISHYLDPLGYLSDKLYCHTYHATSQQVRDAFNAGRSQGTYSGHGAETYWADGPVFYQSDVNNLTNTVYPFIQSFSCLTGSFGTSECFGETWIRATHGAVAFFGSSVTSYWDEDDILEKKIYEGIYDDQDAGAVDQTWIGGMVIYGKLKYYAYWGNTNMTRRYFEMYNILGDAAVDLWTSVPSVCQVVQPQLLLPGQTSFEVTVTGTPHAMVVARQGAGADQIFATAWTDQSGHATVNLGSGLATGTVQLAVTAHDRVPYFSEISVGQAGPYPVLYAWDATDGDGDGDGGFDPGETINVNATLMDIGTDAVTGMIGTLSTSDPYVQIVTSQRPFPDIAPGRAGTCAEPFVVQVSPDAPDGHQFEFVLTVQATQGQWPFSLGTNITHLNAGASLVDDSLPLGNGNGGADAGERCYWMLWIHNGGPDALHDLTGTLSSTSPYVIVLSSHGTCLSAPAGGDGMMSGFQIEVSANCPSPTMLPLHLLLTGPNGYSNTLDCELPVGAWVDDAELHRGWALGATGDDATSGFWVRAVPVGTTVSGQPCQPEYDHTPDPGAVCFVTGNGAVGGAAGDSDVDGGTTTLLSPVFALAGATTATVDYWRWYTNDLGGNPATDYWDVDVTSDGVNWVHLEHTTLSANSWTKMTFHLEQYVALTNQVQLRFVASDLGGDSMVEAAIDDFTLTTLRWPATSVPGSAAADGNALACRPNPLLSQGEITYRLAQPAAVRIGLYDVSGRLVKLLLNTSEGAGEHSLRLERGVAGDAMPSGIYFLRMDGAGVHQVKSITVIR